MSLVTILMWSILGIVLGMFLTIFSAGWSASIRNSILKQVFRSNKDGWALVQRGKKYSLEPLTRDEEMNAWRIGDEDEAEWKEDPADLMHSIHGVPLGLCLGEKRPMADIEAAAAGEKSSEKATDGGLLSQNDKLSLEEIQDRLVVGKLQGAQKSIMYVNPFVETPYDFVDLRNITKLFRHDADSDTPRKAAKNAKEAERAFDKYGGIKEFGKIVTAFMLGAIATYIGGSGGGGGGGGGVPVPIYAIDVMLGVM